MNQTPGRTTDELDFELCRIDELPEPQRTWARMADQAVDLSDDAPTVQVFDPPQA